MKQNEKEMFCNLIRFKSSDYGTLSDLIETGATPEVLGYIFFNRMQGISYGVLKENKLLGKVNREFRTSLRDAYERNIRANRSYYECVDYLSNVLNDVGKRYAMLKGAVLCGFYPEGYRCANDIDILVHADDISVIGNHLLNMGFEQGNIRNGEFVKATRREIIESKMTRGETVPYIKEVNLPEMKYLEVDINFSLDYKNSEGNSVDKMLNNQSVINIAGKQIRTLSEVDFFLHLCAHLYKEATTYPWILMKRDMSMYKFSDIYMILCDEHFLNGCADYLLQRSEELNLTEEMCFAINHTAALFGLSDDYSEIIFMVKELIKGNEHILHKVFNPANKTNYIYKEEDIFKRFFTADRAELLMEVQ